MDTTTAARIAAAKAAHESEIDRYSQWNESAHKRGQPKNKGQFTSGGGAGGGAAAAPAQPRGGENKHAPAASKKPGQVQFPAAHGPNKVQFPKPQGPNQVQFPPAPKGNASSRLTQAAAANGVSKPAVPPAMKLMVEQLGTADQPKTAPPPGPYYAPNPAEGKAARVGVAGDSLPPPPKIGRLPNLTPEERAVESAFAEAFEADPKGMAREVIRRMAIKKGTPGSLNSEGPNVFGTDDVKMLFKDWEGTQAVDANGKPVVDKKGKPILSDESKAFRSKYNTALHQTANALAKRAFVMYLEEVVSKQPEDQRSVLVSAGGVAAGKGYAIENVQQVNDISKAASATWDTAGEQNSTEMGWVADQCKRVGAHMTAVYVHAEPEGTWENPDRGVVQRAANIGRMVDALPFVDSYTHGASNFHAFHEASKSNPNVSTVILDNTRPPIPDLDENGVQKIDKDGKPAMKADVVELPEIPETARNIDHGKLYQRCLTALNDPKIPPHVKQGGAASLRIWPPPHPDEMQLHGVQKFSRIAAAKQYVSGIRMDSRRKS